jgi:hypothetical protein
MRTSDIASDRCIVGAIPRNFRGGDGRFGKKLEFVFFSILCFGFVDVEA